MKSLKKASIAVLTAGALMFGTPQAAFADSSSYNDTVKELVRLNPGSTYSDMNKAIRVQAKTQGKTPQKVANEALKEAREYSKVVTAAGISERSSSGGGKDAWLKNATAKGDIFFDPKAAAGFGHVGIYYTTTIIVEAPGPGSKATNLHVKYKKVSKNTEIMHVRTSQANRNKAANRAWTYRGRSYPTLRHVFNRTANGDMNCSQLVWAAYKTTTGLDIDINEGQTVYPKDIRDSRYTYTYKYVTK